MSSTEEVNRLTGMVKWFNNKSGFGFVTVCGDGEYGGKDIFTHYSAIRVTNSQYKYLVQGEYVDFNLVKSDSDKHEFNAGDVTGVMGGPILCETRRAVTLAQSEERREKSGRKNKGDEKSVVEETASENVAAEEAVSEEAATQEA
jgi:cold shock CspA family protein